MADRQMLFIGISEGAVIPNENAEILYLQLLFIFNGIPTVRTGTGKLSPNRLIRVMEFLQNLNKLIQVSFWFS